MTSDEFHVSHRMPKYQTDQTCIAKRAYRDDAMMMWQASHRPKAALATSRVLIAYSRSAIDREAEARHGRRQARRVWTCPARRSGKACEEAREGRSVAAWLGLLHQVIGDAVVNRAQAAEELLLVAVPAVICPMR